MSAEDWRDDDDNGPPEEPRVVQPIRKTNTKFVHDLMEYSKFGALTQAFIIEAITQYASKVAQADPKDLGNGLINGHRWQEIAKDVNGALARQYGG